MAECDRALSTMPSNGSSATSKSRSKTYIWAELGVYSCLIGQLAYRYMSDDGQTTKGGRALKTALQGEAAIYVCALEKLPHCAARSKAGQRF